MSIRANVVANYAGQSWRALMSFAFVPLYAKQLGMESYALVGLFSVLQAWLQVVDLGLRPAVGREMARYRGGAIDLYSAWDLLRTVEVIVACMAAVLFTGTSQLSNWAAVEWFRAQHLAPGRISTALTLMGAVVCLQFIEGVYSSALSGLERQVPLNVIVSISATLRAAGAVAVLVWVSPTIEAFFTWQVVASTVSLLLLGAATYISMGRADRPARVSASAIRSVWRFSVGMMGIALLSLALTQIDKVLLSRQLPLAEVGYYMLAAAVAGSLSTVSSPIGAAYYPRLVALASVGDEARLAQAYHSAARLNALTAGTAAALLVVFGDRILLAWTGDPLLAQQTYPIMRILAVGTLMNAVMSVPYLLQLAHGWTRLTVTVNAVSVALLVPAVLWTVPRYGAIGAASIWAILNGTYLLVVVPIVHQRTLRSEKWRWYVRDVGLPISIAIAASTCCRWLLPERSGQRLTEICLLLFAGAIVLGAGLSALRSDWITRPARLDPTT